MRFSILVLLLFTSILHAQNWNQSPFSQKVFIENAGQLQKSSVTEIRDALYSTRIDGIDYYFTPKGIVIRHDKQVNTLPSEKDKTKEWKHLRFEPEYFLMNWVGGSDQCQLSGSDKQNYYHTFPVVNGNNYSSIKAYTFTSIRYENIYPGIDVEYTIPKDSSGIKYNIIVHPGGDPNQIKMEYSIPIAIGIKNKKISNQGDLVIESAFGDFTDHAPISFQGSKKIESSFVLNENVVSFKIASYDKTKLLVIDPWLTNPAFAGFNAGYDINYDNAGNVYVFGSYNPLQLTKFDNSGAPQWTYNMLGGYYAYGDFAVDEGTGFSYLAEGKTGPTLMHKLDPTGALVLQNACLSTEMWRMEFNRVTNEFLVGATGSGVEIMDVNLNFTLVTLPGAGMNDNSLMTIDNCTGSNNLYVAGNSQEMIKVPANTLSPNLWTGTSGYTFQYAGCRNVGNWVFPVMGYNGMAVSTNWLYTYDGDLLKRWNKNTGAFMNSVNVTGNPFLEGGLTTDHCDNVYVGGNNSIIVYDPSFNVLATIPLTDTVYDIKMGKSNLIYACGQNFVEEIMLPANLATTLTLSQTPSSCSACSGTATVVVTNSCLATTYLWSPGGQTTTTATGLCPGAYTVTVTNGCNDIFTNTVTVLGPSALTLTIAQQNILCFGQNTATATVTPNGAPPYTYLWNNAQTTQTATGLSTGTYTVTVTDAGGCTQTITVTITQPASAVSATLVPVHTTCGIANGSIAATVIGGTPGYTYSWAPSGGTTATASGLAAGNYTVTVTDANNCTSTYVMTVNASTGPTASSSSTNVSCNGSNDGTATATATGTSPFTYLWSPSGGTNAMATGLIVGTYTCLITDANGCTVTSTTTITQPAAIPAIASASLYVIPQGGSSQLNASGGLSYLWSPSTTLSCSTCQNPVANPQTTTTYCVTVTDAGGCTATACVTVVVDIPCGDAVLETLMPTAFSPNNDGSNDQLCVPANLCITSFSLKIYDRWGEKVFETENIATCWDGEFRNKPLNTAVFVYHFVAKLSSGEDFQQKGNISLVK